MKRADQRKYGAEFEAINRRYESKYFPKVHKAVNAKKSSLIEVIKTSGIQAGQKYLSDNLVNKELSNTVMSLYKEVGLRHARKVHRYLKEQTTDEKGFFVQMEIKGFGFNARWIAFILNYLSQFLLDKITYAVNKTTNDRLQEIIQEGVANGWGIDRMVQELEDTEFTKVQAARIVRTEVNRAANVGTAAGVDTSAFEMDKIWLSAQDRRTRGNPMTGSKDHADHWNMNGKIVGFNERFVDTRSGAQLEFPGDPRGGAADTINCRCTHAPIARRNEQGKLIPRQQAVAPVLGILRPPIAASPMIGLRVGKH